MCVTLISLRTYIKSRKRLLLVPHRIQSVTPWVKGLCLFGKSIISNILYTITFVFLKCCFIEWDYILGNKDRQLGIFHTGPHYFALQSQGCKHCKIFNLRVCMKMMRGERAQKRVGGIVIFPSAKAGQSKLCVQQGSILYLFLIQYICQNIMNILFQLNKYCFLIRTKRCSLLHEEDNSSTVHVGYIGI